MAVLLLQLLFGFVAVCRSQIELDDRFLEYRKQGMWLVEFYAPWCGYCKKLEPIYAEVDRELKQVESPVRVAKLDCTKYSQIATEFSIRGFPTILFIQGDRVFTHRGDRTKEDIVKFALRAQGPTVRKLGNADDLNEALKQHDDSVFFLYVGDNNDEQEDLFKMYSVVADMFAVDSFFYYGVKDIGENFNMERHPTVLAVKDKRFYEYKPANDTATESSLQLFINRERYATFPTMSGAGLNDLVNVVKFLVILALEPQQLNDASTTSARLFHVVKEVAFDKRDQFHRTPVKSMGTQSLSADDKTQHEIKIGIKYDILSSYPAYKEFQFMWMDNADTVNNIAMSFLATPVLMVMETEERLFYLAPSAANLTVASLTEYLTSVAEGKEQAFGGTGIMMRLKGMLFDLISLILSIWQTSRWLFFLILGLPTMIISMICYSLCCMEVTDDIYGDEEEDEMYRLDDTSLPPITPWHGELPPYGDVSSVSLKDKDVKKKE